MGRRKRHKHKVAIVPMRSMRHQEFIDLAEMCEFAIPRQLQEWKRFFVNEERFLDAAETWLQAKMEGVVCPRIEDDVDKRMMNYHPPVDYHPVHEPRDYMTDQREWWRDMHHIPAYTPTRHWKAWAKTLPMEHKLPAPSGKSGVNMETVF